MKEKLFETLLIKDANQRNSLQHFRRFLLTQRQQNLIPAFTEN
jgi:hypothetical protein